MADQRRTITLSVKDDFSRVLKQLVRGVTEASGGIDKFGKSMRGGGMMQGVKNVRDMTLAFNGMVQSIGTVVSAVDDFATLGTTARRNEFVLRQLTGTTKEYEAAVNAVTTALAGSVTQGEAAGIASNLLNLGLADSAAGIEEFTRISNVIAAMSPTINTAEEAVAQIGLTIANMSFLRLDQLGLSVVGVKDRMKELQAETKGMTREAAFQQAVMEGLTAKADLLGDGLIEIGGAQARVKAQLRGFKETLAKELSAGLDTAFIAGEQLLFVLNELGGTVTLVKIITEVTGLSPEDAGLIGEIIELGAGVLTLGMSTLEVRPKILEPEFHKPADLNPIERAMYEKAGIDITMLIRPEFNFAERDRRFADLLTGEDSALIEWTLAPAPEGVGAFTGGAGIGLPGILPGRGGTELVIPVRLEVPEQSKADILNEILGISQEFDPATSGFAIAREEAAELHAELKGAAHESRNLVSNVRELEEVENLSQKFGLDPESFDLSVFAAMQEALRDAGVETDMAADAMEKYQLQTGIATGASLIFEGQMATLAEQLGEGAISAEEYVAKVTELSLMDFSQIDSVAEGLINQGHVNLAQEFIDILSAPGGQDTFERGMENAAKIFETLGLLEVEKTPAEIMEEQIDEAILKAEELSDVFVDLPKTWGEPVGQAMNLATGEFETFAAGAIEDIVSIEEPLAGLATFSAIELFDSNNLALTMQVLEMMGVQRGAMPAFFAEGTTSQEVSLAQAEQSAVSLTGAMPAMPPMPSVPDIQEANSSFSELLLTFKEVTTKIGELNTESTTFMGKTAQEIAQLTKPLVDLTKDVDQVTEKFSTAPKDWGGPVKLAMDASTGSMVEFRDNAFLMVGHIEERLHDLEGTFTITVSGGVGGTGAPGSDPAESESGGGPPQFQGGGFTGTGTQPFLAMLHPNEIVIPLDDLGAPGVGMTSSSSAPVVVESVVEIDGVAVFNAVGEAARKEGVTV